MGLGNLLGRAVRYYGYEEPIRRGEKEPPAPRCKEYAKQYFREWDENDWEEKTIALDEPQPLWIFSGVQEVEQIDVEENKVTYHYYSTKREQPETYSVKRSQVMPKQHRIAIDSNRHHSTFPHMFESMLCALFTWSSNHNFVVGNRHLIEKKFDQFFSYFDTYATGEDGPSTEMERLEEAFRTVFRGSNIDEQAGLHLISSQDGQVLESFDDFSEDDLKVFETEEPLGWRNRLWLGYWIVKTRLADKAVNENEDWDYVIDMKIKSYPDAGCFGFDYGISVFSNTSEGDQN